MTDDAGTAGAAGPVAAAGNDAWLDVPNCPDCLVRMEDRQTDGGTPYWACPSCGGRRIA